MTEQTTTKTVTEKVSRLATFPDLAGRSVFVTGGGKGIGAALTEGFLQQGARVAFLQRGDGDDFCDAMEERYGARPLFVRCDLTDTAALQAALARAAEVNGDIQVLVNNAANDTRHTLDEMTSDSWDANLAVNLKPYFFATQTVAPAMRLAGEGAVVNFSSISYMTGNSGFPAYATANAAITGLTRALARELGPDNIRVNAVAPGWTLTARQMEKWATPELLAAHLGRQCLKEHLSPGDIAHSVLFLSSMASRMVTGQVLVVDGGVATTG
ncbi:MAG: SDR family oxidoreductase [Alphaproteobacteria bacterium]|nr:SDR family oxidoreductase [Alphaproteobacteria bacterium]MDA7982719.1 SDR family oxidoreductase [Alphaproteobacteria bacterium]MDA7988053.1 SDR family oxidoreductase [Alphaproteobacteria bacterium]MDA8008875.1 SDR family oxidoreductase [Alphaproteobacteria bacterium]